ncbi:hypothetical protein D4S03_05900 [bacterium]|nr:MAG: hypothetical protein D4S03_05900 [bacterium]
MKQNIDCKKDNLRSLSIASGIILILLGVTALLVHRLEVDAYLVLLAGAGLLAVGSVFKKTVLIVIGCLLGGTGMGILVYAGPWNIPTGNQKGLFMLCIAIGWFLIPLFTRLFMGKTLWLAFVPGVVAVILAGTVLATNDFWIMHGFLLIRSLSALITAIELILIGSALIVPWRRMNKHH